MKTRKNEKVYLIIVNLLSSSLLDEAANVKKGISQLSSDLIKYFGQPEFECGENKKRSFNSVEINIVTYKKGFDDIPK